MVASVLLLAAACGGDDSASGFADAEFTESDARATVEAYYAASEAGDADGIEATFATGGIELAGTTQAELVRVHVWDAAQGTVLVDRACTSSDADSESFVVVCDYGNHQYLQSAAGAPATPITDTITVTAAGLEQLDSFFGTPQFPANDAFNRWMSENHPDDAAAADCCGEDGSIEDARSDGELRRHYGELWAEHLDETGCSYEDVSC